MYFKTSKTSDTGTKFVSILEKMKLADSASLEFTKKIGAEAGRRAYGCVAGGISSLIFNERPDTKLYRRSDVSNEWFPRKNTKEGKTLIMEMDMLPTVSFEELNKCVGYNGGFTKSIGFRYNPEKGLFGFELSSCWKFQKPADCDEITESDYKAIIE